VNIIHSSAKHLYTVVNDVLDFSKIESGKMELSMAPLDVHGLIHESLGLCQYSIQKNLSVTLKHDIHPDTPKFIIGDETRLRQILVNLIGNACKFTEDGEIIVAVAPIVLPSSPPHNSRKRINSDGDRLHLEFSVADCGSGISQHDQTRLFQNFTQIDVSRKWAGTGLGLAICKKLVEAMGGQIFVKSVVGKGSTFYFRIPVDTPLASPVRKGFAGLSPSKLSIIIPDTNANTASNAPSSPMGPNSRPSPFDFSDDPVLVVEDNPCNQKILKCMLEKLRCKVTVASNGFEAIDLAAANKYSIIFMDQYMPECDGITAAKKIRENCETSGKEVPKIIAFTGTLEPKVAGIMDGVLVKPVRFGTLSELVTKYCKNKFIPAQP